VFIGFSRIFLLGILIFKGLAARRLYKSFGVKGLVKDRYSSKCYLCFKESQYFGTGSSKRCEQQVVAQLLRDLAVTALSLALALPFCYIARLSSHRVFRNYNHS
jgi:hypothetical protein